MQAPQTRNVPYRKNDGRPEGRPFLAGVSGAPGCTVDGSYGPIPRQQSGAPTVSLPETAQLEPVPQPGIAGWLSQ